MNCVLHMENVVLAMETNFFSVARIVIKLRKIN